MQYIYTSQEQSMELANYELNELNKSFEFIKKLDEGIGLFSINIENSALINCINTKPIVFIRHIFAVDSIIEKDKSFDELVSICNGLIISNLNIDYTYAIQIRENIKDNKSEKTTFRNALVEKINESGFKLDVKNCEQVVSIFIDDNKIYLGVSPVSLNLSNWNGGMRHYKRDENLISRAEYKLREAFEVFNLNFSDYKVAIDLGAAPGGWSSVLLNEGIKVIAIDPAKISPLLVKRPKFTHYRETTQVYLSKNPTQEFDLIVNDMKMNVFSSLAIIDEFYFNLKDDGIIITTIKLPDNDYNYSFIKTILSKTENKYKLINARQLFHNRSEITVVLKKY